jgi:8-oxo-dGTP pyrophosphatase MutT (NUDIX family)
VTVLRPAAAWLARVAAAADAPPRNPRVPLRCGTQRVGSVEPDLFARAGLAGGALVQAAPDGGWTIAAAHATAIFAEIAETLHATGLAHVWRDEQLAVRGDEGSVVGTIERAAARALGLTTHAVHLTAVDSAGRVWVQQRALDKPTDPGRWDTLVGGLVPHGEALEHALERETWEEAGLCPSDLRELRYGGRIATRRPLAELAHGYVEEVLHWWTCVLPDGVTPANQDGEVAAFRCMDAAELLERLQQDEFTLDAALILLAAYGATGHRP